jgi:hypothetical protein
MNPHDPVPSAGASLFQPLTNKLLAAALQARDNTTHPLHQDFQGQSEAEIRADIGHFCQTHYQFHLSGPEANPDTITNDPVMERIGRLHRRIANETEEANDLGPIFASAEAQLHENDPIDDGDDDAL